MVGTPSTGRSVTVASVCTDSGGLPASARMLDRAIEKQAACAAAISCSGFEPGPSSKRDLYVYPPLIVSPAVKVPVPVGTSPFHSALPFAGIATSLFQWLFLFDSPIELPRSPIRLVEPFFLVIWDVIQRLACDDRLPVRRPTCSRRPQRRMRHRRRPCPGARYGSLIRRRPQLEG